MGARSTQRFRQRLQVLRAARRAVASWRPAACVHEESCRFSSASVARRGRAAATSTSTSTSAEGPARTMTLCVGLFTPRARSGRTCEVKCSITALPRCGQATSARDLLPERINCTSRTQPGTHSITTRVSLSLHATLHIEGTSVEQPHVRVSSIRSAFARTAVERPV